MRPGTPVPMDFGDGEIRTEFECGLKTKFLCQVVEFDNQPVVLPNILCKSFKFKSELETSTIYVAEHSIHSSFRNDGRRGRP